MKIPAASVGTICDLGITDANNMGAAMAPAAEKTIFDFLRDSGTSPSDYDLILTGDLGSTGSQLLYELFEKEHGIDLRPFHNDCGLMIYDLKKQDVNSGGSGCGCSGSVLCSHILKEMHAGRLMDLKNNIKIIGSFQKAVNALYAAITVIRIAAVAFLILQTVVLICSNRPTGKTSI